MGLKKNNTVYKKIALSLFMSMLFITAAYALPVNFDNLGQNLTQKERLTETQKKIQSNVLALTKEISAKANVTKSKSLTAMAVTENLNNEFRKINSSNQVQLYIKCISNKERLAQTILNLGGKVDLVSEPMSLIQAWLPYDKIEALAKDAGVKEISFPDYAHVQTGSKNSEGDEILKANMARNLLGYTGKNIKVGVISDGINGISASQASGDIPATYEAKSARSDNNLSYGAEGLAMMEIVHDLAPDASMAFSNCGTSAEMLNAIKILDETYNCDVIVDDLGFFGEPWFEDGPVAKQAIATSDRGKIYVSAAGNDGHRYYEGNYSGTTKTISSQLMDVQDFNGTGDWNMQLLVPAGKIATIFLQWNDKFGASGNDYDLFLTDSTGTIVYASSQYVQDGNDNPFEYTFVINAGSTAAYYYIVIRKFSAITNNRIKLITTYYGSLTEYSTPTGSVYGHPAATKAIAVGAIDHVTPDNIESFSSQGPVRIDYPSLTYRQKPDICGIDGVSVTGNGGFTNHFYGTSAAAPHIAAVAALIWSSNKSLTNNEVKSLLLNNCVDLGASGFDNVYGYGRADAYKALSSASSDTTPPTGSISINSGAAYTTSQTVILTLSASDSGSGMGSGAQMSFSNDNINWSTAENYNTSKSWSLSNSDGSKIVYVKFKDAAGNWSTTTISDSILLDLTSPTGSISINSGDESTNSQTVTLTLSSSDSGSGMGSGAQMSFSNDNTNWSTAENYNTSKSWTLTSADGDKTVYAKFKDAAGNWSTDTISDSINFTLVDITPPTGSILINNNTGFTNVRTVSLTISATDEGSGMGEGAQMAFRQDDTDWTPFEDYKTSKTWEISGSDGYKNIYIKIKDAASNGSNTVISDAIIFDTTPPVGIIAINASAECTSYQLVSLNLSAKDEWGSVLQMSFSNDNINWSTPENFVTSKSYTLPSGNEKKTVYVKFKDSAGNWGGNTFASINLMYHLNSSGISMVSIPFYPATGESSATTVNVSSPQLSRWDTASTDEDKYKDYPDAYLASLEPGKGYFLKLAAATAINASKGRLTPTAPDFEINLNSGWNQIGNPFLSSINWKEVKVKEAASGEEMSMEDAIAKGTVKNGLWTYSGGSYQLSTSLEAWCGYWVYAAKNLSLYIPTVVSSSSTFSSDPGEKEWSLQIAAVADEQNKDICNYLGISEKAEDGYDLSYDIEEPPPFSEYVNLYFPAQAKALAVDVRKPVEKEKNWEIEVKHNTKNDKISLQIEGTKNLPEDFSFYLTDKTNNNTINIKENNLYAFNAEPNKTYSFSLKVSKASVSAFSSNLTGVINYPNPFNPTNTSTNLKFSLAKTSDITVRIFDIAGRLTRTLNQANCAAGTSTITWDGKDTSGNILANGVYFYLITARAASGEEETIKGKIAIWK